MRNSEDILNELKEYGVQLPLATSPEFEFPDGYFDSLSVQIMSEIRHMQFLESMPSSSVLSAPPPHYFDSFPESVLSHIRAEDFLSKMPKQTPFVVNAEYFESLALNIKKQADSEKGFPALKLLNSRLSKISVAASLILILAISFILMMQKPVYSVEEQLALIPDSEIADYITQHQYEFDTHLGLQTIDETEIDLQKLENEIYSEYLKNVSDDELEEYL